MAGEGEFSATLRLQEGYRFSVALDGDDPIAFEVDELPPLGQGAGPSPARLLATAVGHCLGASLLFCLRKSRIEPDGLQVRVEGRFIRNERGRLRIGGLRVRLAPGLRPEVAERAGRCLGLFEDFCIVTESIRAGLPVEVVVEPTTVAVQSAA